MGGRPVTGPHTIDVMTFVYWRGDIACRFTEALTERARGGSRMRLLGGFGARRREDGLLRGGRRGGAGGARLGRVWGSWTEWVGLAGKPFSRSRKWGGRCGDPTGPRRHGKIIPPLTE